MTQWERRLLAFLFDVRTLSVLAQMAIIAALIMAALTIGRNFTANADKLGDAQFICRDGTFSYRCAYDFMANEAGFDISDTLLTYENTDSYWWAIVNGILNTFRVGLLAIAAMTVLGVITAIARLSSNWLVSRLALLYVEIVRNTPVLIQLLLIYFVFLQALPNVGEALEPLGLGIFLSNRGIVLPWPRLLAGAPVWLAFVIMAAVQFQLLWLYLGWQEERTGRSINRIPICLASFLLIVVLGWVVASQVTHNEGALVRRGSRIEAVADFEKLLLSRARLDHPADFANLPAVELDAAALHICVVRGSNSEANFTNKLRRQGLPYQISRYSSPEKAMSALIAGDCEVYPAPRAVLLGELNDRPERTEFLLIPVSETPVTLSVPRPEKFNIVGGLLLKGEFFALFLGLTVFYAGGFSEVVRAGILSVSLGQSDAARALGLTESQRIQLVVLPQALRVIIPPMISAYLSLMKDTSLGVAVAFPEMYILAQILMNQSGRAVQIMVIIMMVYLSISLAFSLILNWYNARILKVEFAS
ncbi:MAG: ABC transporter permease subunit [Anaerolineales bacterium]|nr:ABC transporter permease subunit [Anaerolineales bacterium]